MIDMCLLFNRVHALFYEYMNKYFLKQNKLFYIFLKPRWCSGRAFASHGGNQGLIPDQDRPKSLKQTAPLLNARQQV